MYCVLKFTHLAFQVPHKAFCTSSCILLHIQMACLHTYFKPWAIDFSLNWYPCARSCTFGGVSLPFPLYFFFFSSLLHLVRTFHFCWFPESLVVWLSDKTLPAPALQLLVLICRSRFCNPSKIVSTSACLRGSQSAASSNFLNLVNYCQNTELLSSQTWAQSMFSAPNMHQFYHKLTTFLEKD